MKIVFIVVGLCVLYTVALTILYVKGGLRKSKKKSSRGEQYGFLHNALLTELPYPYAVLAED